VGGTLAPPGPSVFVDTLTLHETECLRTCITFECDTTDKRFCSLVRAGVDEQYKDAARVFTKAYHQSPEYRFQAEHTTQFKDAGMSRKYAGSTGGPLHPTAKQAQTARFATHVKCAGTWSEFKGRWCECGLPPFDWVEKSKHCKGGKVSPHRVEQDHCCVNVQGLADFVIECLNAGLGEEISTPLTFAAVAHWTLSFYPADPTARFAHNLPACYFQVAPVQVRHSACHRLCSSRSGHPDVPHFPPTECVVGLTREQLNDRIEHTPSKGTRSKSNRLHPAPDPNDSPRSKKDSPARQRASK
jgi:hypothetical protein